MNAMEAVVGTALPHARVLTSQMELLEGVSTESAEAAVGIVLSHAGVLLQF